MINPLRQPWQWWFEWGITALLIAGVILTSFNIYPLNIYILLVSNLGWVIQAVMWRKTSLFVVQLVVTMIYVIGIINTLL
jgi:hypothetical protein